MPYWFEKLVAALNATIFLVLGQEVPKPNILHFEPVDIISDRLERSGPAIR